MQNSNMSDSYCLGVDDDHLGDQFITPRGHNCTHPDHNKTPAHVDLMALNTPCLSSTEAAMTSQRHVSNRPHDDRGRKLKVKLDHGMAWLTLTSEKVTELKSRQTQLPIHKP